MYHVVIHLSTRDKIAVDSVAEEELPKLIGENPDAEWDVFSQTKDKGLAVNRDHIVYIEYTKELDNDTGT